MESLVHSDASRGTNIKKLNCVRLIRWEENVVRFYITVDKAILVQIGNSSQKLATNASTVVFTERILPNNALEKATTVHKFAAEVQTAVILENLNHLTNVRMIKVS